MPSENGSPGAVTVMIFVLDFCPAIQPLTATFELEA
jgi:hypothetical protein